jgi:hypothetical protein
LDMEGREHSRFIGFLAPAEMIARILLNGAKSELFLERFDIAKKHLDAVLTAYQETFAMPEVVYYSGVLGYLTTHEAKPLRKGFERLEKEFPQSEWTMRARPYGLLDV